MEIKVFSHKHFIEQCPSGLYKEIVRSFIEYKTTGVHPKNFGRDTAYDRPPSVLGAGLRHIHIKDKT